MGEHQPDKPSIRFLSFANDRQDTEKDAKLKAAAEKIEQSIAKEKALNELIEFQAASNQEETIDPEHDVRSLYERLQEQRSKKQEVIDEAKKLSNYVAHLDEDDANYLNEVAKNRREEELRKRLEIQDAFEAKKRLDEQKMLDEEKRRREYLLGGTTRDSKSSKSRLYSMIKVKTKPSSRSKSDTSKKEKDDSSACPNPMRLSSSKRPNDEDQQDGKHTQKKRSPSDQVEKEGESARQHLDDGQKPDQDCEAHSCECAKDVAKVVGVLPSSLIVSQNPKDSDDSDYSDHEFDCRLVPKGRLKRR